MISLFSGTANINLSKQIADLLKIPLSKSEVVRFDDSEVRVRIIDKVQDKSSIIVQSTANPTDTNLMELFFFADALKRKKAKEIIAVIPYFGYARQNIQHREGECVSANVVIRFLEAVGFTKVYTVDLHDEGSQGIFSIPFKNLSAIPYLARSAKKYINNEPIIVVSPDQGGVERTRHFAESFFDKKNVEIAVIEKKRNQDAMHQSIAMSLFGEVANKSVIMVDDIVTSGGTLINAARLCLEKKARKVIAVFTHHDFSPSAPQKLQNSCIDKFITTNTITLHNKDKFKKLEEISIASLIAKEFS